MPGFGLVTAFNLFHQVIYIKLQGLYNLSLQKNAPAVFGKLNKNGVLLIGVVLNYLVPAQVFIYVTRVALYVGPVWFGGVIASYYALGFNRTTLKESENIKKVQKSETVSEY